jgi:hypothetical protein
LKFESGAPFINELAPGGKGGGSLEPAFIVTINGPVIKTKPKEAATENSRSDF